MESWENRLEKIKEKQLLADYFVTESEGGPQQ